MPFQSLTYQEIVALTRKASERQPRAHFKKTEIDRVNDNVERNPFLKAALSIYPPAEFNKLRERYYEEHRAVHQEMNVHDPIFESARGRTRTWLAELPSSAAASYDASQLSNYKTQLKVAFDEFVGQGGLSKRYSTVQELQKARENFEQYFDKIFEVYLQGASHPETLMYYMQWCAAGDKEKQVLGKSEDRARFEDLFLMLDDARNAYKDSSSKFYPPHDWSCPPGMEERLLDMLTSIRKADPREQDISTAESYVTGAISPFISAENNRSLSEGLYAVYESLAQKEQRTLYRVKLTEDRGLLEGLHDQIAQEAQEKLEARFKEFESYQQ